MRLWRSLAAVRIMEERPTGSWLQQQTSTISTAELAVVYEDRTMAVRPPAEIGRVVPAAQVEQV